MGTMSVPTRAFIVFAVKTCTTQRSLRNGTAIHAQVFKSGHLPETMLVNHLLNMYVKLQDMHSARDLFNEMSDRNLVSFSTLISGYSRSGEPHLALHLVPELQRNDLRPNQFVFSSLNLACSKLKLVNEGKQIHAQVVISGYGLDPFVKTSLIDMYSKLEDLDSAASIFYHCLIRDHVTYNSMISGFVSCGSYQEALELFVQARRDIDMRATEFTFSSVIKAVCYSEKSTGEQIHALSIKTGHDSDCFVGTTLVDMYGKFGDMECSLKIYRHIFTVDLTLYNAVISGLAQNGMAEFALKFYAELLIEGYIPNESTFSSVLRACTGLKHPQLGRLLHGVIEKSDFRRNLVVNTALIDMYMKNGYVEESWRIFRNMPERNTISYNSMIGGLGQNAKYFEAVKLFANMNHRSVVADLATFIVLLSSSLGYGRCIYAHAVKHGYGVVPMVQNSLLDCLLKEGATDDAVEFFEKMFQKSVVSWTTIISGLGQLGFNLKAVQIFKRMQVASVNPNCFTISCVLKACGHLSILELGKCVHGFSVKHGTDGNEFTVSSMLDMYANCGALEEAHKLFEELPNTDVVSWNSMITALCKHGNAPDALMLLDTMANFGVKPNHVTFISLLSSCSHCGFVDEAIRIFDLMTCKYEISPSMEHYACMVDLYGRIGLLDMAKELVDNMPMKADVSIWKTILAASRLHGNLDMAKIALDHITSIENLDKASYVTVSNLYAKVGKWEVAEELRTSMRNQGVWKNPGVSSVYVQA